MDSYVCKSQCLISTLTQGGKGGNLFRLTCSGVFLGGRDAANKYRWCVWGVLVMDGPPWICHNPRQCGLPGSTLLRLQAALQGHCSKWALHFMQFLGLSHPASWVLYRGKTRMGVHFVLFPGPISSSDQVLGECTVPGVPCILITSWVWAFSFPGSP